MPYGHDVLMGRFHTEFPRGVGFPDVGQLPEEDRKKLAQELARESKEYLNSGTPYAEELKKRLAELGL